VDLLELQAAGRTRCTPHSRTGARPCAAIDPSGSTARFSWAFSVPCLAFANPITAML
jgi:hypothetical protein